ncbi:MAG: DUF4124 domain-containing protein [Gammaproteobacteria bacterium]|nr:DUF4124 domain-containing protein [Gammaproteobacteria bacterium]
MKYWLLLASLLSVAVLAQQAYTWTDENGVVHYSDRPFPGANTIELRTAQGFTAPQPAQMAMAPAEEEPVEEEEPVRAYTAFNVLQPTQQETLWNIGTVLNVEVDLQPGLQQGHHLGAYLDGQLIDVGATTAQFQLPDVFRGMHTMQAVVLDDSGTEVLRSLAVSFMVQQTSIQNPANPLAR